MTPRNKEEPSLVQGEVTGNVFSENIEFDVHCIAFPQGFEVGMLPGIGDDGHGKQVVARFHYREADAVNTYGAFVYQQVFGCGTVAECESP